MQSIVVTGADAPLAQRVVERLGADRARRPSADAGSNVDLSGCETLVHLGWGTLRGRPPARPGAAQAHVGATRRLLDAAAEAEVRALVHVSSAIVYGAWSDNAIPLTEEAALRPNPGLADAVLHAEAERVVADWADAHPAVNVSVLRPAIVLGPGIEGWLARALSGRPTLRARHLDPPRQFVHIDDLAAGVALAATSHLDGVFNVAADGWVGGEQVRVLGAAGPTLTLPSRIASAVASAAWSLHLSTLPPEVIPLVDQPWVVANDRLRAAGWVPEFTNEEAVVAGTSGSRWREMSPSRRQELALGGVAAGVAGGALAGLAALRHRRR